MARVKKYKLGKHSLRELKGVRPELVWVVRRAIKLTTQDFTVLDGLRTIKEQEEYVHRGVSQTMESMHLPQEDGYSHAVDLVPYINGKLRWELEACYEIALAMREASRLQTVEIDIRWGGCWQRLDNNSRDPALMVEEYVARKRRQNKRAFIDAPHYELIGF